MALPAVSTNTFAADPGSSRVHLGAPKIVRGRGTYEGLAGAQEKIQQGQTGQGLRESFAARQRERSSAVAQAKADTLVVQAGLPSGLNKALPQSTADVLAVRVQRQNFMFRVGP